MSRLPAASEIGQFHDYCLAAPGAPSRFDSGVWEAVETNHWHNCLLWEQESLPAFWRIAKCLPRALAQRRWIMARRRVSDESLAQWFSAEPSVRPIAGGKVTPKAFDLFQETH